VKQGCTEKEFGQPLLWGPNINHYDSKNSCDVLPPPGMNSLSSQQHERYNMRHCCSRFFIHCTMYRKIYAYLVDSV